MCVERFRVQTFHHLGHDAVQCLALTGQEIGVNRLPRQRVTKGELLGGLLDDQLGRDQFFDQRQQFALVVLSQMLQEAEVKAPAGDGGENHDLPGCRTHLRRTPPHRVLRAARNMEFAHRLARPHPVGFCEENLTGSHQQFENLLDKERVALGQCKDGVHKLGAHRAGLFKDCPDHRLDFIARETRQSQLDGAPFAIQPGQKVGEAGVRLRVVTAVRHQQKNRLGGDVARQVKEKFEAGIIAPMQILDDDEQRMMSGKADEELGEGVEQAAFLWLGLERGCGDEAGQECSQFREEFDKLLSRTA